ncbi:MAG: hypothetical protein KAX49_02355 [Halanaerobiales bacterium]|nr:hypothetical protein [Halanaerobiales bacterium]
MRKMIQKNWFSFLFILFMLFIISPHILAEDGIEEDYSFDVSKGEVVDSYSLFSPNLMEIVLYQKENSEAEELNEGLEQYTIEAQSHLLNGVTISYGYDTLNDFTKVNDTIIGEYKFLSQNAGLELKLLPGLLLNADYKKILNDHDGVQTQKSVFLAVNPTDFTSFNATYGVISRDSNFLDIGLMPVWLPELIANIGKERYSNDLIVTQLGMAVQPTNFYNFFADYVSMSEEGNKASSSKTVLGFQLNDMTKELNATFEMENQTDQKAVTSTGVQLNLIDLASLKAVYSKVMDYQIPDDGVKSIWDLGLNVNFAENTSLQFQYIWVLPQETESDDEKTAQARLEVRF